MMELADLKIEIVPGVMAFCVGGSFTAGSDGAISHEGPYDYIVLSWHSVQMSANGVRFVENYAKTKLEPGGQLIYV